MTHAYIYINYVLNKEDYTAPSTRELMPVMRLRVAETSLIGILIRSLAAREPMRNKAPRYCHILLTSFPRRY